MSHINQKNIRNFCIIAHIDLGDEERQALEQALAGQGDVNLGVVNEIINKQIKM